MSRTLRSSSATPARRTVGRLVEVQSLQGAASRGDARCTRETTSLCVARQLLRGGCDCRWARGGGACLLDCTDCTATTRRRCVRACAWRDACSGSSAALARPRGTLFNLIDLDLPSALSTHPMSERQCECRVVLLQCRQAGRRGARARHSGHARGNCASTDDRDDQRTHLMRRGRAMTEAVPMLTRNRHSPAH